MKLLRILPLAAAVTFTSTAFADTPAKTAPGSSTTKDSKGPSKDNKAPPTKDTGKDSSKDAKPPAGK